MAGQLFTVTVRIENNNIVLNPSVQPVATGDYFHWRFDKASVDSARTDFPDSKLFPGGGAHWGVVPKTCEFAPDLPAFVPDVAQGLTLDYYIAAKPLGCSEALVVKGQIKVG